MESSANEELCPDYEHAENHEAMRRILKHNVGKYMYKKETVIALMEISGWIGPALRGEKVDGLSKSGGCVEERRSVKDSRVFIMRRERRSLRTEEK